MIFIFGKKLTLHILLPRILKLFNKQTNKNMLSNAMKDIIGSTGKMEYRQQT